MSSARKEARIDKEEQDREEDENPTNVGPRRTESYDDRIFSLMYGTLSKGLYQ